MKINSILPQDYNQSLDIFVNLFNSSRNKAFRLVNNQLVELYWKYGEIIHQNQASSNWGDGVIKKLSIDLSCEFAGVSGFSERNLLRMRNFYQIYSQNQISPTVLAELSWSHHTLILEKCKSSQKQLFYIQKSIENAWSVRKLATKIKDNEFENFGNNQTNFDTTLTTPANLIANSTVKDDYNLDFLELYENHKERQLEDGIVANIIKFLDEMGGYFAFIGRQKRLELDGKEYFVDLVFLHRLLNRLIIIELKTGEFKAEYAGKMQLYLNLADEQLRLGTEEESIGIIICKDKHRATVEYTLKDVNRPIGVASYTFTELPDIISKYLPNEEDIIESIEGLR